MDKKVFFAAIAVSNMSVAFSNSSIANLAGPKSEDKSASTIEFVKTETSVTSKSETKSTWTRLSYAASGIAKIGVAGAITAATMYSGYTAFSWTASAALWLKTPAGLTACTQYVAETNGTVASTPLVYALASQLPEANTMCIGSAAASVAKSYSIHVFTGLATVKYFAHSISYAAKSVANFTHDNCVNGLADLEKAYN